ncbi:hypothetical protein BC941DRAFT_374877 [Chlamydoabsidia padenii]|nr:hypothetical protein BC941DRAFT_374877 [Chlamydoabsidia padenii]
MESTSMLLQDFIDAPSKAESILDTLTAEQIQLIEATINSVKKRKLNKTALPLSPPSEVEDSPLVVALAIANALATAMANTVANSIQQQQQQQQDQQKLQQQQQQQQDTQTNASTQQNSFGKTPVEPMAHIKDGVEWVSFVYSHNRVMSNYTIRTDLHTLSLDDIDDKFKTENCVYPRANLPRDQYKGNRWAYETECNVLGWKLAWLNKNDISGKRGLIQRAVDSYRNRYPSMRSRRVARQAKLMNGTLRKRKQRGDEEDALLELMTSLATSAAGGSPTCTNNKNVNHPYVTPTSLETAIVKPANHPKTIPMEDLATGTRCRIKINIETVSLDYIPHDFRLANSPFPRHLQSNVSNGRSRWMEEKMCNELAWKLAWLNPKYLAGKKNMLQRALDLYRRKFMPSMPPRKHSTLSAQNAHYQQQQEKGNNVGAASPAMSCISGTTASLDFADCLSLADDYTTNNNGTMMYSLPTSPSSALSPPCFDEAVSASSGTNSVVCTPSPPVSSELFQLTMDEMYDAFMLPPTASMDDVTTTTPFMLDDLNITTNDATKLFDPTFLSSPSLPSSALQQDLLVKNVDDFTDQLLGTFF